MPTLKGKKIIVSGASGMVGNYLLEELVKYEPSCITALSIDDRYYFKHPLIQTSTVDIRELDAMSMGLIGHDIYFHLFGVKGSPNLTKTQPASFFELTLMGNTNGLAAAFRNKLEWVLYTSTVGVYGPAEVFEESKLWDSCPSPNDWEAGWAKRMGEVQLEAYAKQYGKRNFSIVRPVNIYGKYDNFDPETAMVIPSLIRKAVECPNGGELEIWGDGSPVRDFINARDVANSMIACVKNEITEPINLGSGLRFSIKTMAECLLSIMERVYGKKITIKWLTDKPMGDACRVASTTLAESYGIKAKVNLLDGLTEAVEWYDEHHSKLLRRYDVFRNA